jgi:hypothetical protein
MTFDAQERARLLPFYLATTYRAKAPAGPIDLRIGQPSPPLDRLLDSLGAREWAFISAANPRSQQLSESENESRHGTFRALMARRGFHVFEGEGIPDQPGWTTEPSLLILAVTLEEARELAAVFGQHAIVWGEMRAPARLVWCDSADEATGPRP